MDPTSRTASANGAAGTTTNLDGAGSPTVRHGGAVLTAMPDGGLSSTMPTADTITTGDHRGSPLPHYFGSKSAMGVAQQITSRFPPHATYVELFVGGGTILRTKRPALCSIAIDSDADVAAAWARAQWPGLELIHGCALSWLTTHLYNLGPDTLIYADPPYLHSTRTSRRRYAHELTPDQHATLIDLLDRTDASVFVSGYDSPLYRDRLQHWQHDSFPAMTRGGLRDEHLWWRSTLATFGDATRSRGRNYRDREKLKRRRSRWRANFLAMQPAQRSALLAELIEANAAATATSDDARGQ